ncbi:MAG: methyltransferase domain-containing protein [Chloroflexota bacterium]
MSQPIYDQIDDFFVNVVRDAMQRPTSLLARITQFQLAMMGDVEGQHILDLCCGDGHLSIELVKHGASVVGVDISQVNLSAAKTQAAGQGLIEDNPTFMLDNAQLLAQQNDAQFDIVVCKMALMDIPDIDAAFRAVQRVLKPDGRFFAALLHPCFETPFTMPHETVETDEQGNFKHHRVQRYFEEGIWHSGGTGIRGHVGAHHRKLSTYINSLLAAGFQLIRMEEPPLDVDEPGSLSGQWHHQISKVLYIEAKS